MTTGQPTAPAAEQLRSLLAEVAIERRLAELSDPGFPDDGFVSGLLLSVLDRAPAALSDLGDAVDAADRGRVEQLAHGLKGVALNVGADDLGAACDQLETCARNGVLEGAAPALQRVRLEWEVVEPVLRRLAVAPD